MKYYYMGQLVRTSNNIYKYGLLRDGKIISCSKGREGLERELRKQVKQYEKDIAFCQDPKNAAMIKEAFKKEPAEMIAEHRATIAGLQIVELEKKEG